MEKMYVSDLDLIKFLRGKEKATIDENGCHLWKGILGKASGTGKEYGKIQLTSTWTGRTKARVNRVAYFYHYGPFDNSLLVRHICDNPNCINPEHLVLGTDQDNVADIYARNRKSYDNYVLNSEAVKVIRWMLKNRPARGLASKLARLHKCSRVTIGNIKSGKTWPKVTI